MRVHGIDFSGAKRAGEKVWVASGEYDDGLTIHAVRQGTELFGSADREPVLSGLREWIATQEGAVGLDCSFGLPRQVHAHGSWRAFCEWFPDAFDGPEALQGECAERTKAITGGERTYLKRATDERTNARSPYHWLVGPQTYYGIAEIVAPLVERGVAVEPMVPIQGAAVRLLEIYPAATLRELGLPDTTYKGGHEGERERRETILAGLREWGVGLPAGVETTLLDDSEGDALDSVVAAVAVARAAEAGFVVGEESAYDPVEGYIYV
ncbi:DUF429 domain-containing protein [Natronomonas sp. EA1]|uniref:DUF429 domain-containing protein n=1 Tax=Natronomonas sp. EA1 TaxID=3421655 RepID=UPI003EC0AFCF